MESNHATIPPPLAADLVAFVKLDGRGDEALVAGGLTSQAVVQLLRRRPLLLLTAAREKLIDAAALRPEALPYRPAMLKAISARKAAGAKMTLISGGHDSIATSVAGYLNVFDEVIRTSDSQPIAVANDDVSRVDLARRLLRVPQWVKNLLLFAPLFLAHQAHDRHRLLMTLLAATSFCFGASAIYVCNDALDAQDDRQHVRKRKRPFAAGEVSVAAAPAVAGLLLLASFLPALLLPAKFFAWLIGYLALSTAYSFWLKRKLLVDVIVLASLYTLRLLAGGAAARVDVSPWLLAFSSFLFLSLAFAKRYSELRAAIVSDAGEFPAQQSVLRGRGYQPEDLRTIESVGPCSGYIAALVFALYIHNSELVISLYNHPLLLWLICPLLLYWITRVWFLAVRGSLTDDPLLFAMTDRVSWYTVIAAIMLAVAASL